MSKYRLIFTAVFFLLCAVNLALPAEENKSIDWAMELSKLQPLPKIHYSWGLDTNMLDNPKNLNSLYQLARITHSLCVQAVWGGGVTSKQIDLCVYTCARVNKTNPSLPCSIGIDISPWHIRFGKDLPPTNRGPTYDAEIVFFTERMNRIKNWVAAANRKYQSDVQVGALLLDCERFEIKQEDEKWNQAFRENLDAIHAKALEIFPKARIEWYGRGIRWDLVTPYWTEKERYMPSLSCSLYSLPKTDYTDRTFKKTCELADKLGVKDVTPWVALASGYQYGGGEILHWDPNWVYDLKYSYDIGKKLNSLTDPLYSRAKVIVFYPEPFNPEAVSWPKHFIAYVKGASNE